MPKCLVCSAPFEPFMSFGRMPIANGFLAADEIAREPFFELKVGLCEACGMVQLAELVDREKMFHGNYAFFASTSKRMSEHFKLMAEDVRASFLARSRDPFVVELGSNDGIMLQHFAAAGIRHVGVEPSENVAAAARAKGVRSVTRFFEEGLAKELLASDGPADAILGTNVFCHLPYIHSIFDGVATLLKPDGVLIFEDPYLGDIVEKTAYDQIYDEHAFYFSVTSISRLAAMHGLEVVDIAPQDVHGGSMRYTLARKGKRPVSPRVIERLAWEQERGLTEAKTFERFRAAVEASRRDLVSLLKRLKAGGKRVVGYGATSKSTTVTNYCGIGPDLVEFISDTTPTKQGKLSPGAHIPVRPYDEFKARLPDYALLFAWNHGGEIMAKEKEFTSSGGRFILYVPKVGVVG